MHSSNLGRERVGGKEWGRVSTPKAFASGRRAEEGSAKGVSAKRVIREK